MHTEQLPKLIVVLGPTAAGKTTWSLDLAKECNGEIISADSRQVYKKMDIGTAKVLGQWKWQIGWRRIPRKMYMVENIPHHMIDIFDPGKRCTVAEFRDQAIKYIKMAHACGKVPFLVGGTGLYIQSVVDNLVIPRVEPNKELRKSLEEKTNAELCTLLQKLDPVAANTIDLHNRRRVIRALEVTIFTGIPFSEQQKKGDPLFDVLQIGVQVEREILNERIDVRVDQMMAEGLEKEVEALIKQKYSWSLPSMSGVGYRQFQPYIEGSVSLAEVVEKIKRDTRQYARRQMTWFRRDERIVWCREYQQAAQLVREFLGKC